MLRGVRLRGEISNFKRHSAGHLYFTLKDEEAKIACVMFRSQAAQLALSPCDGMRVILSGSAALYTASGQYQFYVDSMRNDGVGALYIAFEKLKQRLADEGLFDAGRKRPLPLYPRGVGIATSPTGAVLHDIVEVSARRHPGVQLYLCPCAVQGEGAADSIACAIDALCARPEIDVIIIGRGGGSLEELWAFNEEVVARAIYNCPVPIVSAVGHETDFTIADFVADVRAATPSQAAELVVPKRSELCELLDGSKRLLDRAQAQRIALYEAKLDALLSRVAAGQPSRRLNQLAMRLDAFRMLLSARAQAVLERDALRLTGLLERLRALSPENVLMRGYALVTDMEGKPLLNAEAAQVGAQVRVRLSQGALRAEVLEVERGSEKEIG